MPRVRRYPLVMAAPNRLAREPSLYLRQHANDPVDWHPWGAEAFELARELDRPVLLSIGYASCHWCHVMARESFRDSATAAIMNAEFVSIKVDREERPDVDAVYLAAVQAVTGSAGWPLTVALTPEREPFYGGTYFPPTDRHGLPSFKRVLTSLATAWRTRRDDVVASAADLATAVARLSAPPFASGAEPLDVPRLLKQAVGRLIRLEDKLNGGFGDAPKFPAHEALRLLLARPEVEARGVALRALDAMGRGGICDQLGGGFFRYSVDASWHVPHFEKMLYDNAALLRAYAQAANLTGAPEYRRIAEAIVAWLERELRAPDGSYYSALDAESGGEEGRYYVWTRSELDAALPGLTQGQRDMVAERFGVLSVGPVEGASVPRLAVDICDLAERHGMTAEQAGADLEAARVILLAAREVRERPGADDKVLTSWNGLLIGALAEAGAKLADEKLVLLASSAASAVRASAWVDGRLWHSARGGELRVEGLLEDYAYLGLGLLRLYRATFEARHLRWALELAAVVSARFHDAEAGGYFSTAVDAERLIARPKGFMDAATPSENAAAAELVWWAARYQDDEAGLEASTGAVAGMEEAVLQAPQAFASSLNLMLLQAAPPREVVIVGRRGTPGFTQLAAALRERLRDDDLLLVVDGSDPVLAALPLATGRQTALERDEVEAFVCEGGVCRLPVQSAEALVAGLAR